MTNPKHTSSDLVERMKAQIELWRSEEQETDWWKYQYEYAAAADRIEELETELDRCRMAMAVMDNTVAKQSDFQTAVAYDCGTRAGQEEERAAIVAWLRKLDDEGGDINRFLPTTLANWIDERMHFL